MKEEKRERPPTHAPYTNIGTNLPGLKRLKASSESYTLHDTARGPNDLVSGSWVLQRRCHSVPAKPSAGGTISPSFPVVKEREGRNITKGKRWRWALPNDWFKPAVTGSR